ncbi:hypothetical protein EXIGLDRAFT_168145 [Exidia glandulosa HHB12029]|uniref:GmrSD restriction endonucleases N-terminal domain-containing protein n=1 Tax=Exidia glandulosa HHB12029 TaxID=1314781 RepID=A0A165N6H2_EXIGL|nr:hypothetical protein EXIGLDRAFT_168145 [Exidia glandulosa HHB12029]
MARTKADARKSLKRSRQELEEQYEEDELEHDHDFGDVDREDVDDHDDGGFTIRDAVHDKRTVERTCFELHGQIDINPPYQRDIVWKPDRQSALIDSLLKGLHVPPVVFAVRDDPHTPGGKQYICVDGKQRLTSVQSFIDSQIPHIDPVTKKKWYMPLNLSENSGKARIPDGWVKKFHNIKITCVEYGSIDEVTEREIFERVQNGMPLQASEKLQALNGPLVRWINSLQKKYVAESTGLTNCITWSIGRGKDFECIARSIYTIANMPKHIFPGQQPLSRWLKVSPDPCLEFKQGICETLDSFVYLASDDRYNDAFTSIKERVAPVEFVFICLLLAKMRPCSDDDKAGQILAMRTNLRQKFHKEVKANTSVCKWAFAFIEGVGDVKHPKWPTDEALRSASTRRIGVGNRKRRKTGGDDDDDEYEP